MTRCVARQVSSSSTWSIATFASNVHRLQQVVDVAKKYNRKICLTGRSILRITSVAKELG